MSQLVAHWKGENNAVDSINGLNGTWVGTPAYVTGVVGNAFSFDGNPYILVDPSALINFDSTSNFTLDFYTKFTNLSSLRFLIGNESLVDNPNKGFAVYFNFNTGSLAIVSNGTSASSTSVILFPDVFYHFVVKYSAGVWTAKINDDLLLTVSKPIVTAPLHKWHFGAAYWQTGNLPFFKLSGAIDEIKIYDDSLPDPVVTPQNIKGLSVIDQKTTIGFKKETVPYSGETLAASDYNQLAYDVKVIPDIESYGQHLATGDFSRSVSIAGRRLCAINFKIDLYTLSTVAAPAYFNVLECCGWRRIVHGSTGVSIRPDSNANRVPATIEVSLEQEGATPIQTVYKAVGAMGMVKMVTVIGQPIAFEFSFLGALDGIRARPYASRIVQTGADTAVVPAFLEVKNTVFAGRPATLDSFEINFSEMVNLFTNIFTASGYDGARVVDRNIIGKFQIGDIMSLQIFHIGGVVAIGHDDTTGERGFLTKIKNATGTATVKGTLVCCSDTVDNAFKLQADEFDTVGVIAEAGVADGAEAWVWKNGSRCQVLFKDGESSTREYILLAADTDGRGRNIAVPSSNPVVAEHFKECGHVAESKSAGTSILVLCDLHFN